MVSQLANEDNVMKTPVRLVLLLGATLIAALPAAAQQLYKYTGPDGKVQYSDRPPPDGRKAEKVTSSRLGSVPSAPVAAANTDAAKSDSAKASAPKTPAEQDQAFRQRRLEQDEKARKDEKLAQEQQAKAESCAAARRELAGMQNGARVGRINEKGERIFLDDNQVQGEIARMEREIATGCK